MGEVLVKIMDSPVAPLVLLLLFWLAYRDLRKQLNTTESNLRQQINGAGNVGRGLKDFLLETEAEEEKRKRLNDLLRR